MSFLSVISIIDAASILIVNMGINPMNYSHEMTCALVIFVPKATPFSEWTLIKLIFFATGLFGAYLEVLTVSSIERRGAFLLLLTDTPAVAAPKLPPPRRQKRRSNRETSVISNH